MVGNLFDAFTWVANSLLASGSQNSISEAKGDLEYNDQFSGTLIIKVTQNFSNTDTRSGVGCTISGTSLRTYVRNSSDSLEARLWDFTSQANTWHNGKSLL